MKIKVITYEFKEDIYHIDFLKLENAYLNYSELNRISLELKQTNPKYIKGNRLSFIQMEDKLYDFCYEPWWDPLSGECSDRVKHEYLDYWMLVEYRDITKKEFNKAVKDDIIPRNTVYE